MEPADVLFVHNNFPGQFGPVATVLQGMRCRAIGSSTGRSFAGIPVEKWALSRGTTRGILPDAIRYEADLIRGRAAAQCAVNLKRQGFDPKLIVGHSGWGETIFLREIFPAARQAVYAEYYYRSDGGDVGFDPEFESLDLNDRFRVHAKNGGILLALAEADAVVAPTPFQAGRLPRFLHERTVVIHEGIDTDRIRPNPAASLTLPDGRKLTRTGAGDAPPVVTFINRRFEPLRGYHIFMRALPALMSAIPDVQVVLIGADEAGGYGQAAPEGTTWGQHFLNEVGPRLDRSRLHFLGRVAHEVMLNALAISSAHVYYTYPFVLSWSMLEAMACECLVIASDTGPVRDAIIDGDNGLLLDFFDVDALSRRMIEACRAPDQFRRLRRRARETVIGRFDRKRICEPRWLDLVSGLLAA